MKQRTLIGLMLGCTVLGTSISKVAAQTAAPKSDTYTNSQCQRNQNLPQRDRFTVFYQEEFVAQNQRHWLYASRALDGSAIFCLSRPNFEQPRLLRFREIQNQFTENVRRDRRQNTSFVITIRNGNGMNVPINAYRLDLANPAEAKILSLSVLQRNAVLKDGDPRLSSDGSLYHTHTFNGQANQSISLNLQSRSFDHYVAVFDPNGQKIAESYGRRSDDFRRNRISDLVINLPTAGRYQVVVNGSDRTSEGEYSLNINRN
ncbi:PPC domain-containing protein [Oscillatoria amoena NRMC-F 0135]|nr:PPC domain-containing protein [Geitlerinema splendidum]MDL5047460.1 PPC domain-containing protein [Oscillatoria amoena NRMC-F 0135]